MARPRAFDEFQVMDAAREVFRSHGFASTSVEHLTDATGLSRSSLYGAFGDKRGLFLQSYARHLELQLERLGRLLGGGEPGALDRLRRHLRSPLDDPDAPRRGCLIAASTAELAESDPAVATMTFDFFASYEHLLTDAVRVAQAAGDLRADLDPAATGALLLAVLRGTEALSRAGWSTAALHAVADQAIDALRPPQAT